MKIFPVVLIVGTYNVISVMSKCSPLVAFNLDPYCGILPTCYQNALNKQVLSNMSCARKKNGKPDFLAKTKGECPTDKPPCPPDILQ